jgi:hypothetical protein
LHDGSFKPNYQALPKRTDSLPVAVRLGKHTDLQTLAKILHETLWRDFDTIEKATRGVEKWIREMPDYTVVAEYEGSP